MRANTPCFRGDRHLYLHRQIDDGEATIVKDYLDMERTCILEAVEHLLEFWNSVLIHRDVCGVALAFTELDLVFSLCGRVSPRAIEPALWKHFQPCMTRA